MQPGTTKINTRDGYGKGLHRSPGMESIASPTNRIVVEHKRVIGIATGARSDFFAPAHSEVNIFIKSTIRPCASVAPSPTGHTPDSKYEYSEARLSVPASSKEEPAPKKSYWQKLCFRC